MIDPVRHRQLEELNVVEQCTRILSNSRNELYLNMRFLDVSLSSLVFQAEEGCGGLGTDGFVLYYQPEYLMGLFQAGRVLVNRSYLHMVFHCLFCHPDNQKEREEEDWNLACDIAVESMLDGLHQACVHVPPSPYRREFFLRLNRELRVHTAQGIYRFLQSLTLTPAMRQRLREEFYVDDHRFWKNDDSPQTSTQRQNRWNDNREKMQTNMETFSQDETEDSQNFMEQIQVENRDRYDYKHFLRKFSVLKEELLVDPDSFDYGFYTYGLSLYGNMPLVEPLETKEVKRIEDFVIVIDTSMSCSGELVKRFLEETYSVLSESESYFRKINVHILQCDDKVQSHVAITSRDEMNEYMETFTVMGHGGTDFRPAFDYVRDLLAQGQFVRLRGLLYFTDGKGIYPVKMPPYDTAFIFWEDQYSDVSVPPWAIKLILEGESLREH